MTVDARLVGELRRLAVRGRAGRPRELEPERCDLCSVTIEPDHRHMIHIEDRRIVCVCEPCRALLAGEGPWRTTGTRVLWLEQLDLRDELWARLAIPIGLAFFLLAGGRPAAFYPSPAGPTECELDLEAWDDLVAANPVLAGLDPEGETLLVNRLAAPPQYVLAPVDEAYRLVGIVRTAWQGISGGDDVAVAVTEFFAGLERRARAR
jgi:Family of unknown function (DUF5947)